MKTRITIGSVSEGSLLNEDLFDAFIYELRQFPKTKTLANKYEREFAKADDDIQDEIVNELQDKLNDLAPAYMYFGTSDGDGACFGWWPITDDDSLPRFEDVPDDFTGDAYKVNDHGNITCGYWHKGNLKTEYWSCV